MCAVCVFSFWRKVLEGADSGPVNSVEDFLADGVGDLIVDVAIVECGRC